MMQGAELYVIEHVSSPACVIDKKKNFPPSLIFGKLLFFATFLLKCFRCAIMNIRMPRPIQDYVPSHARDLDAFCTQET
jgi:hypothetical protein